MATTFRSDVRAGALGLLSGWSAANAGSLNSVHRATPKNLADRPLAFIQSIAETNPPIRAGTWDRNLTVTFAFVWAMTDDGETADIRDDVIDSFMDYCARRPHAATNTTITEPRGTEDVELERDGAFYTTTLVQLIATATEGRD